MEISAALVFAGKSVAAPAISFLANKAFNYLNGYCHSEGMEITKNRVFQYILKIEVVFEVVNPEYIEEQGKSLDAWLWQLRDAVEEAEDAIDELEYHELNQKVRDRKVSYCGPSFANMKHRAAKYFKHISVLDNSGKSFSHNNHTLKRLSKAVLRLDEVATGVASFITLADRIKEFSSNNCNLDHRETGSLLTVTAVFGRNYEKSQIVDWLTSKITDGKAEIVGHLPVVSVVGHGGMGKTTLAQLVCNDDRVMKYFEKIIWVFVSTTFDAKSVTSKLIESATGERPSADTLEALQKIIREKVMSCKVLIILDDVWDDKNVDQWEKLFAPLRTGSTGSKVLLTTRIQSVAEMAANVMKGERNSMTVHGLHKSENLLLFNHHAFAGLNPQNHADLQPIGEEIARKLRGCPLVTKVAGDYLRSNMTCQHWNNFLYRDFGYIEGNSEDVMKVLKLSYYHLPAQLQVCFRYCSIFPQGYHFKKEELVRLWVGSGLIPMTANGTNRIEDIAEEYLTQLTRKSFFCPVNKNAYLDEQVVYYVVHDLLHDLAKCVSMGECARIFDVPSSWYVPMTARHLCIEGIQNVPVEEIKKITKLKHLRTIIITSSRFSAESNKDTLRTIEKVIECSKSLWLLKSDLRHTSRFADKLANLKHLRYVGLPIRWRSSLWRYSQSSGGRLVIETAMFEIPYLYRAIMEQYATY